MSDMKTLYADGLLALIGENSVVTWTVESDGMVVDLPEWCALTGQSPEASRGEGWMDAVHPDDVDRVRSAWRTAVSHGANYNTDYRICCADGIYRWFNARGIPMLDADGSTRYWIGVILPIPGINRFIRPSGEPGQQPLPSDICAPALCAARAMLGWSAGDLAAAAGVSLSTIRRLEDAGSRDGTRRASIAKVIDALREQPLTLHCDAAGLVVGVSLAVDPSSLTSPVPPAVMRGRVYRSM